ncbi:MAG: PatB family C-S lyase [Bacteroidetes bacterium]|nr:PatB family C-S lyase [Bacteroidota bacterium]
MKYNFDEIICRENTSSVKYDMRMQLFGRGDVLPVWVADMDFRTPDFVLDAIRSRAEHPILGYSYHPDSFFDAFANWMKRRHNWQIERDWIVFSPGIVPALNVSVLALTCPGDKIIVQPPVYFPFFTAIKDHGRVMAENPLLLKNGRYFIDFKGLENLMDGTVRMLMLCSPHNPGGMVWTEDELKRLIEICVKNNVLILSDEIHSDLVFQPYKHVPTALIGGAAHITIACYAPSKTFNLAGMSTSVVIIPEKQLRDKFTGWIQKLHIGWGNLFGTVAFETAYNNGDEWLEQLLDYVNGNIRFVVEFCKTRIPRLKVMIPESTYMLWLDFKEFGLNDEKISRLLIDEAKLGLSHGPVFGTGGSGFQRMNVACPRSVLVDAMNRIENAFVNQKS